ncbi:MAG: hypothetical protein MJ211_01235 [Bacteroidales bacterium]|nr:hypothetical protein [Bacteroidales bacterium]
MKRISIYIILNILLLTFSNRVFSSDTLKTKLPRNHYLSVRYLHGPVYDHRDLSGVLNFKQGDGISVEYLVETNGVREWETQYNLPRVGVAFYYEDFHYNVLGKAFSTAIVSEFPCVKNNFFGLDLRFLAGVAYVTKKFDTDDNPLNLLVGSRFSAFFCFGPQIQLFKNQSTKLILGGNFVHYSNGCMQLPNLGLNLLQWHIGVESRIGEIAPKYQGEPIKTTIERKWTKSIVFSMGARESGQPEGPKYCITSLTSEISHKAGKRTKFGFGVDLFRDPSDQYFFNRDNIEYSKKDFISGGIHASYGFNFGKTSATLHFGSYMFSKANSFGSMYHRVAVNYLITNNIIANLGLRTYFMKAEYIEWGIGYQF